MPTSALINIYMYAYACIYAIIAITIIIITIIIITIIISGHMKDEKAN